MHRNNLGSDQIDFCTRRAGCEDYEIVEVFTITSQSDIYSDIDSSLFAPVVGIPTRGAGEVPKPSRAKREFNPRLNFSTNSASPTKTHPPNLKSIKKGTPVPVKTYLGHERLFRGTSPLAVTTAQCLKVTTLKDFRPSHSHPSCLSKLSSSLSKPIVGLCRDGKS